MGKEPNLNTISEGIICEEILKALPDLITVVDKNFVLHKVVNANSTNSFFPSRMQPGRSVMENLDPEKFVGNPTSKSGESQHIVVNPIFDGINECFKTGMTIEREYSMILNGEIIFFEGRYKLINDNYVICVERNITKSKRAEILVSQTHLAFSEVIDAMPIPVFIKDINSGLKYIFWNKESELKLGYSQGEILGKTDIQIYGPERGGHYIEIDNHVITINDLYEFEDSYETPDGKKNTYLSHKMVIKNDIINWLLTARWDITGLVKAQDDLQEANKELEIALAITSSVPLIWDIQSDFIQLKFEEFKEKKKEFISTNKGAVLSETIFYIHPEERQEVKELIQKLRNGEINTIHKIIRYDVTGKYNSFYEVLITVTKWDNKGIPTQAIGNLRDITLSHINSRKLEEALKNIANIQKLNQIILDNSNNGLVLLNNNLEVQWENLSRISAQPYGQRYKVGEICYEEVMRHTASGENCMTKRALRTKQIEIEEITLDDGHTVAVTATPVLQKDGSTQGVVLRFDDITAQRKAAEELQEAKEAAEASDRLKSVFISNMSHEIRTPLNAIIGFSELLVTTNNQKEKEDFLSVIKDNNEQLLQLINDILDLSKIESNTLEFVFSNVNVNEQLSQIEVISNRKIKNTKDVVVSFKPPVERCIIHTEKNRLRQVMLNLVNNAIKFTNEGFICIGYEIRENDIRFYVKDTGIGVPKEKQKEIFKRFIKLNSFIPGTGLGLSICETIIKKLGGEIGMESVEGKGSTFWFTLPVLPIENGLSEEEKMYYESNLFHTEDETPETVDNKPILLVAEDSPDNYKLFCNFLEEQYDLLHAWDGKEAIELYEKHSREIETILMDIKMPVVDGFEAARVIREKDQGMPIVAVSAYAFPEDVKKIMNSGFDSYLSKPVSKNELIGTLKSLKKKN